MKDLGPVPLTPFPPSDPRWELALRVSQSSYFRKGPKLRAFLLYVCENAILGRTENLTAQLIGTKVFGRSPAYDLSEDNIVRVEARELRKRLETYFTGEGRDEAIVIEIPKGSYAPVFRLRDQPPEPEAAASQSATPASPAPALQPERRWRGLLIPLLASIAVLALAAAVWLAADNVRLRDQAPITSPAADALYRDLLGTMGTTPTRETLIVLSNPNLLMYYGSEADETARMPRTYRAPEELKTTLGSLLRPADRNAPYHVLSIVRDDYTGIGEAVSAFHLGQLMQRLHRPARLTQSRFLNWDHVQKQDLVLLGGPGSNDWTYQNDAKSNFLFVRDVVENAKPMPGERSRYLREGGFTAGTASIEYGVLKMLTSPYGFKTLLFAGVTSAGTAGVGEFFTDPQKIAAVHKRIRAVAPGKAFPTDWEMLIRIAVRDGIPLETSAVAVRPAPAAPAR